MDSRSIVRLLRHVFDAEPEEISCSECFDLLSVGVELEPAGATWEPGLTRLGRHFGQCRVCRDEYETLRDFVRVEAESASDQKQRRRGMTAMIRLKRGYEKPSRDDGVRILMDRLWSRGLTKARAALRLWLKGVASSAEPRKWFGHDLVLQKVPEGRKR